MYLVITRHNRTTFWSPTYRIYETHEEALTAATMFSKQYHNEMHVRLYELGSPVESWNESVGVGHQV
jgi:hypothetical protein